jgi:menaquinone-dependent protoporphyrinogen oxidase
MSSSSFNPLGPAHYAPRDQDIEAEGRATKRVGVFYATREGQTRRVALRVAADLRERGFDADLQDVQHTAAIDFDDYAAAVLAASVHAGSHETEMVRFVKGHRAGLERLPTVFLSVTLSEAGAEKPDATPAQHAQFVADVDKMVDKFFEDTQWRPKHVKPVAGALLYTQYNFLVRFLMKRIARKAGAATDTSRDYEYTNWAALDSFVDEWAQELRASEAAQDRSRMHATVAAGTRNDNGA